MTRIYTKTRPAVRFMSMVNMDGPSHPQYGKCWIWTGARLKGKYDYGVFTIGRGQGVVRSHRFAWSYVHGDIPEGMFVLHKCDRPCCVNPDHLFVGNQKDNMDDMQSKGRRAVGDLVSSKGEKNPKAKLTEHDIHEIRRLRPFMSLTQLAARFRVHIATIKRVMNGKRWSHI